MPTGSGSAIIAAGSCRIGVRSFQLEAMNSAEATPVSPATNSTTISARARQARSLRLEARLSTTRTNAWSRRR